MKTFVIISKKLLVAVWHIIKNKEAYKDYLNKQPEKYTSSRYMPFTAKPISLRWAHPILQNELILCTE